MNKKFLLISGLMSVAAATSHSSRASERCFYLYHDSALSEATQELIKVVEKKHESGAQHNTLILKQYYPVMSYSENEVLRFESLNRKEVSGGRQYYFNPPYTGEHALIGKKIGVDVTFYPSSEGEQEKGELRLLGLRLYYAESKCYRP